MARVQTLCEVELEKPNHEISLKEMRQNLNQLRQQARELDQVGLEDCLSLAISLTSNRYSKD
ncbi:MAG: hypothetical protein O7G83_01595 [Proteobacteria bacterium]|nr:hypothetical protein [Pseudomonadota bacterium]